MLSALIFAALVVADVDAMSAQPAPCPVGLAKCERQIAHSKFSSLEGPTISQTVGAQLHGQPTSAAVKSAESKVKGDFQLALVRAGEANARGDAAARSRDQRSLPVQSKAALHALRDTHRETPRFQGMKSSCAFSSALVRVSPLVT